ncbi:pre-mRNA-splicing factor Prp21p [Monosporozyma servazzii]
MDEETKHLIIETASRAKVEGPEYTNNLLATGDEKFAFLMQEHPYHEYYYSVLKDNEDNLTNNVDSSLKDPSPFMFINYDPAGVIPPEDLNVIKKTAEYYVISTTDKTIDESKDFLNQMKRELTEDPHFDFLKDDHSLYPVFKDFISQYKKILVNDTPCKSQDEYLRQCFDKATYNEYKKQFQKENKETQDLYKIRFAAINWLKFHTLPHVEVLFKAQGSKDDIPEGNIKYKEPLDFSKLSKKQISNTKVTNYINQYFAGTKSPEAENPKENSPTSESSTKTKKRKGKILIKEKGETRISKKRK